MYENNTLVGILEGEKIIQIQTLDSGFLALTNMGNVYNVDYVGNNKFLYNKIIAEKYTGEDDE